jgi:hypothetical protein
VRRVGDKDIIARCVGYRPYLSGGFDGKRPISIEDGRGAVIRKWLDDLPFAARLGHSLLCRKRQRK